MHVVHHCARPHDGEVNCGTKTRHVIRNFSRIPTPCHVFNLAIELTSPSGEIVILDTAGWGPMTINNSLAAVKNGYGTVRRTDKVISSNTHGLVNCGSDQFGNPGAAIGCAGYNSPGKIVAQ